MARDTRAAAAAPIVDTTSTPNKRKRRSSPSPAPAPTPLKVILPSPSSISHANGTHIGISPPKVNGDAEHEPKRQKISLKISPNGVRKSPVPEEQEEVMEVEPEEEYPAEEAKQDQTELEVSKGRPLSKEIRGALALVISQMAVGLPSPLNGILSLWLPPNFEQKEENTLGYILRQDDLSWESLVEILYEFSENLLVPCSYPNPMPSLEQCRLPVSPLPSHFPPHIIYNFCASLHSLTLQIAPPLLKLAGAPAERWALMQKTPANGQAALIGGDWFTTSVDIRVAEEARKKMKGDQEEEVRSLLEVIAGKGDKLGHASAVAVQSTIGASSSSGSKAPKLSETVIRRASLKMQRWKEQRTTRHAGGFGSIARGVGVPAVASTSFTPSFAPTFDSTFSTGGMGYHATLQAMHERGRHKEWSRRVLRRSGLGNMEPEKEGWWGSLDREGDDEMEVVSPKRKGSAVDDALTENASLIRELQAWQEVRLRKGVEDWVPQREKRVAEELLASLTRLAENVSPSELLPQTGSTSATSGLAHDLTKRFIPVSSPIIRGTLDPRRPHGLHDNLTVRLRSPTSQSLGGSSAALASPHAPPPRIGPHGYMAPPTLPQQLSVPPPHVLPTSSSSRYQSQPRPSSTAQTPQRSAQPYDSAHSSSNTQSRPQFGAAYAPYTPNSTGNAVYGRTTTNSASTPARLGPGPSSLRQSFGPTTPGSSYGTSAPVRAPTINPMAQQMRSTGTPSRL